MRVSWRWCVVALGVAALLVAPSAVAELPVDPDDVSAQVLLERVRGSADAPYSGYAESTGGLVLPVTDQLGTLADLLGDTTQLRTWFRAADDVRVDEVRLTGERGHYVDSRGSWTWDYEANRAVRAPDPDVRVPRAGDLLPTELGRRLLSEARADEVTRLPTELVAGRDAPGLRLTPTDERSTIREVDVWVDPGTGLPLRVRVVGDTGDRPVVATSFLDFDTELPAVDTTTFRPPPGAEVYVEDVTDLAAVADRFAEARAPAELAGLARRDRLATGGDGAGVDGAAGNGAVGSYGQGVTALVAVPLPRRAAGLRDQLRTVPGAVVDDTGVAVAVGPLSLLVTPPLGGGERGGRSWLLTGTVTADTLAAAAAELAATA